MFGDGHAYSQPLTGSGTVESIKSLTRDDLVEHAQTRYARITQNWLL